MTTRTRERPQMRRDAAARAGKIGPNAVIQLVEALRAAGLEQAMAPVFAAVGATAWLAAPPAAMVDAAKVGRLHHAVRASLPLAASASVMADAGLRTADYLLAARIPGAVQWLLKRLPARLAARLLVAAIRAHAWTFAGSGRFSAAAGSPTRLELTDNPLCAGEHARAPVCRWHAAVFERLFQVLVSPRAQAIETSCAACGDACCRFVLTWRPGEARRLVAA